MTSIPQSEKPNITSASLPAILIGGPAGAGKSILTYNLTYALHKSRRYNVPHYTFRASPDGEGNWLLKGNWETVFLRKLSKRQWTQIFRDLVSRDIPQRQFPLLVDIGGRPCEEDRPIFQACTHVILLLNQKDELNEKGEPVARLWHSFIKECGLELIAEIYTHQPGPSIPTATHPIITGTLTLPTENDHDPGKWEIFREQETFQALLERIKQLFGAGTPAELARTRTELERRHMTTAPSGFTLVNLPEYFREFYDNNTNEWTSDTLPLLLEKLPAQQPLAVYGSGPAWLYGALTLHAPTQPFYQFDARLGWRTPPLLSAGTPQQSSEPMLKIDGPYIRDGVYTITITPDYGYLDYYRVNEFMLPEPPKQGGVIIGGKLPLWYFTALARFYAQRNVSWIALNDAFDNRPVIIYSMSADHPVGLRMPEIR
jgi:CRISPR-associated protein Csx3